MPAAIRHLAVRLQIANGHRHLLHLRRRRHLHCEPQGLRCRGRRRHGRRSARGGARSDRQVLAAFCATHRLGYRGHFDRILIVVGGSRELRRRSGCRGFRQLAESHSRPHLTGGMSGVPTVHEGNRQAAFGAVRTGGRLYRGHLLRQGRLLRLLAPAGGQRTHIHAVQA